MTLSSAAPLLLATFSHFLASHAHSQDTAAAPMALVGATVHDGVGGAALRDAVVILRNGLIESVGPRSEVEVPDGIGILDLSGKHLVPGLIDMHVHYSQTGWVDGRPDTVDVRGRYPYTEVVAECEAHPERFHRAFLASGVTAVFDVGGYPWTRKLGAATESSPEAPHVIAAGPLLSTFDPGLNLVDRQQMVFPKDEEGARAMVRSHAQEGSRAIKFWFVARAPGDVERFTPILLAVGDEAANLGLPLIVHATELETAKVAVAAGAHLLVHSVQDAFVDDEFVEACLANGTSVCPTLTVFDGYSQVFLSEIRPEVLSQLELVDPSVRDRVLQTPNLPLRVDRVTLRASLEARASVTRKMMEENLMKLHAAGVPIVMGTDAGNPLTLHGPSVFPEMEAMQRMGMTASDVLISATSNAARVLGRGDDLGRIAPGYLADLVVVEANPSRNIRALRTITHVVRAGKAHSLKQRSSVAQIQAALDPSVDGRTCNGEAAFAAYNSPGEEAASEQWRGVVLDALRDPRTRPGFRYFLFAAVMTRSAALQEMDPDGAIEEMLEFFGDVRASSGKLSKSQLLLLDYCEARTLRESGRIAESLRRYEDLERDILALGDVDGVEGQEVASLRSIAPNEHVRNLMEVGLIRDAVLFSRGKDITVTTLAELDIARGRTEAALAKLAGVPSERDRSLAVHLEGVAHARAGNIDAARVILGAVAHNEWPSTEGDAEGVDQRNGRGSDPTYGWSARQRSALVLAELEAGLQEFEAIPDALESIQWRSATTPLYGARRVALSALWAAKTKAPHDVRGATLDAMRKGYSRWIDVWKRVAPVPGGLRFLQEHGRRQLLSAVLGVELADAAGSTTALQRLLEAQSCGTLAKQIEAPEVSVAELAQFLQRTGGGIVIALPLSYGTHLFVMDGDGVAHRGVASRDRLDDLTPGLRDFMESSVRDDEQLKRLRGYARLVTDEVLDAPMVERMSHWTSAIFVGLDRLTDLPPALLFDNNDEWLGCSKIVVEWPSVPVGLAMLRRPPSEGNRWTALIDPRHTQDDDLPALRFSEAERERLSATLGNDGMVRSGMDASIFSVRAGQATHLYLHCHGKVDPLARRPGILLLAGSEAATASDIERHFLGGAGPEVVILAACYAGRSRNFMGEDGSESLSSAFIVTGARSLLVPRREVFHEPTKAFSLDLLSELRRGTAIGEAVRRCRSRMSKEHDPRDATGLRLLGSWD